MEAVTVEPTEMELRVALVLCVAAGEDPDAFTNHSYVEGRPRKTNALCRVKEARAAIQAMREPTVDMWDAAAGENGYVTASAWRAMIDTASPPAE